LSNVAAVTNTSFETEVLKSSSPVLVDFWAEWCGPCKMIAPIVDKIADQYKGRLKVVKLDTDENPDIAVQYDVHGIPCLILFKSGEPVDRVVGYVPQNHLATMLDRHLAAA
jgi:thioredoxin 1